MRSIEDLGLVDGRLEDTVVFWHLLGRRHAVVTGDYTKSSRYLARLLRHYGVTSGFGSAVTILREAGEVMPMAFRQHSIGLMRPYLYGRPLEIRRADPPVLICQEQRGDYGVPILTASTADSERVKREIAIDRGIDASVWRTYECEVMRTVFERLALDLVEYGRLTRRRTRLEAELVEALGSAAWIERTA
jgi:hypothetical protein